MKYLLLSLFIALSGAPSFAEDDGDAQSNAPIQMHEGASTYDALLYGGSSSDSISDEVLNRYSIIESGGGGDLYGGAPVMEAQDTNYDFYTEVKRFHSMARPKLYSNDVFGSEGTLNSPYPQFKPPTFGTYQNLSELMKESADRSR